jgi:uncharacterized membrane protein
MAARSSFKNAPLALAIAVYAAVRLWDLTASCLWFDEIFSIHAAEHSWSTILDFVALDLIHPPLFYLLLKLWLAAGTDSILWVRLLPVLISLLAVVPFIGLCRELRLKVAAQALAVLLLAINGSLIKYAQEVRMYSLLLCIGLFSTWLFARSLLRDQSVIPLIVVNILLVHTHYFGWLVVIAEVVAALLFNTGRWRRLVLPQALVLASFLPWMAAVWSASRRGSDVAQNIGWVVAPGIREITKFILGIIEPFNFQASSAEPVSIYSVSVPLLLLAIIAVVVYAITHGTNSEIEMSKLRFLLIFVLVPSALALVASWFMPYSVWGNRHLIIVFAPACILLAVLFTSTCPKWVSIAFVTSLLIFSGYGLLIRLNRVPIQYSWCSWDPLTAASETAGTDEPVYVFEDLVAYHIWFARRHDDGVQVKKIAGAEDVVEDKAYFLPRGFNEVSSVDLQDVNEPRIWVALRAPSISEAQSPLNAVITRGYRVLETKSVQAVGEEAALIHLEKPE